MKEKTSSTNGMGWELRHMPDRRRVGTKTERVLELLRDGPLSRGAIMRHLGWNPVDAQATLRDLLVSGEVLLVRVPGQYYAKYELAK